MGNWSSWPWISQRRLVSSLFPSHTKLIFFSYAVQSQGEDIIMPCKTGQECHNEETLRKVRIVRGMDSFHHQTILTIHLIHFVLAPGVFDELMKSAVYSVLNCWCTWIWHCTVKGDVCCTWLMYTWSVRVWLGSIAGWLLCFLLILCCPNRLGKQVWACYSFQSVARMVYKVNGPQVDQWNPQMCKTYVNPRWMAWSTGEIYP